MTRFTAAQLRDELLRAFADAGGRPLIAAHRGTTLGSFPDNTLRSGIAAILSGADIVEFDVIRSTDGEFFLFHNGYEEKLLAERIDLRTLTAAQIADHRFAWHGGPTAPGVERLVDYLTGMQGHWLNVDRSWGYWPEILDVLAEHGDPRRLLLKSPPIPAALTALAEHEVPFLFFPIVRSPQELEEVEAHAGINVIGAELLARSSEDPFADPAAVSAVAARHPLVQINALNLDDGAVLYLGYDDDTSILRGPEHGWDRLVAVGATVIQTDWPHLLRARLSETHPQPIP